MSTTDFDPNNVNLTSADPAAIVCFLEASGNEYNGHLGARISSIFVIMIISTLATFFPVVAKRVRWARIPLHVYLFARYFGAGVIVATAFIHLLDPAYAEIGPNTCVGMTGQWAEYSWPPAIVLVAVMVIFIMDLGAQRYVEMKYGLSEEVNLEALVTGRASQEDNNGQMHEHSDRSGIQSPTIDFAAIRTRHETGKEISDITDDPAMIGKMQAYENNAFRQQSAAFLILEFGVIVHSVIIGLNLGVAGSEFSTLYPVLIFHQSFEGLGIGARMSAIPFPKRHRMLPWILCTAYGLTTPVGIAIGLGLHNTYNGNSYTANIVSGVLDSTSAGILIYTGLVELLARDFLFDPLRTKDDKRIAFMVGCVVLGAGIMALLGKWA